MKNTKILSPALFPLCIIICVWCTGCVTLYKPSAVHSPLVSEKGQLNTSAAVGLSGTGLINLQGAYAVTNHAAIAVDGMHHLRNSNINGSSGAGKEKLRISSANASGGYFTQFGKNNTRLFQSYVGGGYGKTLDYITGTEDLRPEISANFYNVFVQPGIAWRGTHNMLAIDVRLNYVQLYNMHAYLYDSFDWWNTDFRFYNDTSIHFMNLEPAVTVQVGGKSLKGVFQVGTIIPVLNSQAYFAVNNSYLLLSPFIKISAGITFSFHKIK